jgi:hypothetical protein
MGDVLSTRSNYVEARHRLSASILPTRSWQPAVETDEQKKRFGGRHGLCVNWEGGRMR